MERVSRTPRALRRLALGGVVVAALGATSTPSAASVPRDTPRGVPLCAAVTTVPLLGGICEDVPSTIAPADVTVPPPALGSPEPTTHPDAALPDLGLPALGLPDLGLPDPAVPDSGLPDLGAPGSAGPDQDLPDPGLPLAEMPAAPLPAVPPILPTGLPMPADPGSEVPTLPGVAPIVPPSPGAGGTIGVCVAVGVDTTAADCAAPPGGASNSSVPAPPPGEASNSSIPTASATATAHPASTGADDTCSSTPANPSIPTGQSAPTNPSVTTDQSVTTQPSVTTTAAAASNPSVPARVTNAAAATGGCDPSVASQALAPPTATAAPSRSDGGGVLPTTGISLLALAVAGMAAVSWGGVARMIGPRRVRRTAAR